MKTLQTKIQGRIAQLEVDAFHDRALVKSPNHTRFMTILEVEGSIPSSATNN